MDKTQAKILATEELIPYRLLSYHELTEKLGTQECFERLTEDGNEYRVEVDFMYDDEATKAIRVFSMISYSLWTDFSPISECFIKASDGKFIDE